LNVAVCGRGLHEITHEVAAIVDAARIGDGLWAVFVQHTSASLVIQENADPSAARDLEAFLERLVQGGDPLYTHTAEGPDDMPAYVRSALTATSLSVPVVKGRLDLGIWQGVFLWEHCRHRGYRQLLVHIVA
jgi:secondary thiamine-phosphate synthase enzyme